MSNNGKPLNKTFLCIYNKYMISKHILYVAFLNEAELIFKIFISYK